jgi:CRP-like cAMP-binding protein
MTPFVRNSLLEALDPADRAALLSDGIRKEFAPGEFLITEGAQEGHVLVLLVGWVKIVGNSASGHEVVLSFRTAGDAVGELAALDSGTRSASVIAVTAVTAVSVTQAKFLSVFGGSPAAALALSRSIAAEVRRITHHRVGITGASARRRVAGVMLYLVESYSTATAEGFRIDLPLSRGELAALAGVSLPSLFRELRTLRFRNALVTHQSEYHVTDVKLLREIVRDEDSG